MSERTKTTRSANPDSKVGPADWLSGFAEAMPVPVLVVTPDARVRHANTAFLGQWGIFVFGDSGTIIASDINNGLIIMEESATQCKGMKCSK